MTGAVATLSGTIEAVSTVQILEGSAIVGTAAAAAIDTGKVAAPAPSGSAQILTSTAIDKAGSASAHAGVMLVGSSKGDGSLVGRAGHDVVLGYAGNGTFGGARVATPGRQAKRATTPSCSQVRLERTR